MKLFTIGHSKHEFSRFVDLLKENGISLLIDVRTSPYSRYNPQYNKENIEVLLKPHNIHYLHAGKKLGGRPPDPECYKSKKIPGEGVDYLHEVEYPEVMKRQWFKKGVKRLLELANEQRTAVMCSEEDPKMCHRHHLIAKYIMGHYPEVEVIHIRGDGRMYGAKTILTSVDEPSAEQLKLF